MDFPTLLKKTFGARALSTSADGFSVALGLFREASVRVPAYKDFLKKMNINPDTIHTRADFEKLPRTDKPGYISQYSLLDLSWDGTIDTARYVSTSSGSTGVPFFWPRGITQDATVGAMFRAIFKEIFNSDTGRTLFVDSFALGTWIAGFEFYNSVKWVADKDNRLTIVTPGIDKHEVVNQIKKLHPLFDRVVLAGYPPFVKDVLDACEHSGIDIKTMDLRLMVAGEAISVAWKQKILERIGRPLAYDRLVNVYGMAESGVVAHDTPLAQLLREHVQDLPDGVVQTHDGLPVTGVYQFYPEHRYFEAEPGQALALTANAGLPLIRYDTRDTGGIITRSRVSELGEEFQNGAKELSIDLRSWKLPFVYLNGRKDLSISFYALMIYVENIKYALENSSCSPMLSGLFTMSVEHTDTLDQEFRISIELVGAKEPAGLSNTIQDELVANLRKVNSEYAKLLNSLGERAKPKIHLLPRGHIQTMPGRKHKWVKRA